MESDVGVPRIHLPFRNSLYAHADALSLEIVSRFFQVVKMP